MQKGGKDDCTPPGSDSSRCDEYIDKSSWRDVDAGLYGIDGWKISESAWLTTQILRRKGFQAYLVGGCVRDLLLDRTPKDFDVITSASLKEIKNVFDRARVVGSRFPICHVFIKGSMVDVSSFGTLAKGADSEKKDSEPRKPTGCDKFNLMRWRNCLRRDFTINSLFYDPSTNRIYDYTNGMRDLKLCKVQTVIPAHLSFREDCARILRGLRIAARLGLSFSDETATAIKDLYLSIKDLDKRRLELEMDYMFCYGAAESSLSLLKRFKILDILLPFHAAYLSEQGHAQSSSMLCKLFSSVDKLTACDRPCTSSLWVGVLAIHLALVNHPQDALVVWTLSSVLYYGNWERALQVAREKLKLNVAFEPEIRESCSTKSDKELVKDVEHFASQVISSIDALIEPHSLVQSMARCYPLYPCSEFVCISKAKGRVVAKIFNALQKDVKSDTTKRTHFDINYERLKKGDWEEMRFVLGKIMMDTMSAGGVQDQQQQVHLPSSKVVEESNIKKSYQHEQTHVPENKTKFAIQNQVSNADLLHNVLERGKRKRKAERDADQPQVLETQKNGVTHHPNAKRTVVEKEERAGMSSDLVMKGEENLPVIKTKQIKKKKKVMEDKHGQSESKQEHAVNKSGKLSSLF